MNGAKAITDAIRDRGPTLEPDPLRPDFYGRSVHEVARELIGCVLLHRGLGGIIVETESYAADDEACHAYNGPTPRSAVLFGPPGRAYVYLSYGIHALLNVVAEPDGQPGAVLLRALEPCFGVEEMGRRRGRSQLGELCSGPGKLSHAIGVGLEHDGARLDGALCVHRPFEPPRVETVTGPRVGISKAVERPWRFCAAQSPFVSRPRPG